LNMCWQRIVPDDCFICGSLVLFANMHEAKIFFFWVFVFE